MSVMVSARPFFVSLCCGRSRRIVCRQVTSEVTIPGTIVSISVTSVLTGATAVGLERTKFERNISTLEAYRTIYTATLLAL